MPLWLREKLWMQHGIGEACSYKGKVLFGAS
jgi:hypothetical protein